jgi:hypothetical protein
MKQLRPREFIEQNLRGRMKSMMLLDQSKLRAKYGDGLGAQSRPTHGWVEELLRFHRDRTDRWICPQEMGEVEVEAFPLATRIRDGI